MGKLKIKAAATENKKGTANADKTASTKKETLNDANKAAIASKALIDTKYVYPENCNTPALRKTFRAEIRRKIASFEKQFNALAEKTDKESKQLLKTKIAEYNSLIPVARKDLKPLKG